MERVKLFLDTNIVLDYYTARMGDGIAEKVVHIGDFSQYELCISILTGVNTLYILNKFSKIVEMETLARQFTILPMSEKQWKDASRMGIADPEDALQIACAREFGCKAIISRDRHILNSEIILPEILTPEELLQKVDLPTQTIGQ